MPARIRDRELRLPIVRLALEMLRRVSITYFKEERYGASATDLLLCCAVFVGQAEGKPLSAFKLAEYAGVPRPTAIRKLAKLAEIGIIETNASGTYRISTKILNSDEARETARGIRRMALAVAAVLSKLDSEAIAHRDEH